MFELTIMLAGDECESHCPLGAAGIKTHCERTIDQQTSLDINAVDQIEMSVKLLDTESMRALNHRYRDKDSATNVLSFESGIPVLADEHDQRFLVLGDLVLCPDVIACEAIAQGKNEFAHWAHMIVHGTLHLCGYDHLDPDDATEMENLEIQILSGCDVANPYLIRPVQ